MGLDTTHDCWTGSYSSFGSFRRALAEAVGIDLQEMQGFGGTKEWPSTESEPLVYLLNHSDCDGQIAVDALLPLSARLRVVADKLPSPDFPWTPCAKESALRFAAGCELAASKKQPVKFF